MTLDINSSHPAEADIPLGREEFFNDIIGALSGTLEDVIGLEDTAAFISMVGSRIGSRVGTLYSDSLGDDDWPPQTIARVLVDLKRRIGGGFRIEAVEADRIVLSNTRCPFGDRVKGRASLCMMTTNVFGRITADQTGYARVEISNSIALGDCGCRVTVHFDRDEDGDGHEFYG